jgi:hypothetical protein
VIFDSGVNYPSEDLRKEGDQLECIVFGFILQLVKELDALRRGI